MIDKDRMVALTYTLRELNIKGEIIEEVDDTNPLKFMFGAGQMLPKFEENIAEYSAGDKFEFALTSEDAYGEKREDLVVDIPKSVFTVDGKFDDTICQVGNQVPMADNQGRRLMGVVTEIKDSAVGMDFNHPMAGVPLFFSGSILEVREATEDEINMYHGSGGCNTCGSHSSCDGHC